jgi:hypothetical protein
VQLDVSVIDIAVALIGRSRLGGDRTPYVVSAEASSLPQ